MALMPGLEDFSIKSVAEAKDFCNHLYIISYQDVKFKKEIFANEPDKSFELNFVKLKSNKARDTILIYFSYDISHGKHFGTWSVAYRKS
jgi:CTP:phosphocholine cytidylyltransferase-like protein